MTRQEPMSPEAAMNAAPCRDNPTLWDSRREYEDNREVEHRQRIAIHRCRRCPALDACTRYLQACEAEGQPIDGIVAGRRWRKLNLVPVPVGKCIDCGTGLIDRMTSAHDRIVEGGTLLARYGARGLCDTCYTHHRREGTIDRFPPLTRKKGDAA